MMNKNVSAYINNFMHKVVVPVQYLLTVASIIVQAVYNALEKAVKLIIGAVMELASIVDTAFRTAGKQIQLANQVMKEALLKDYTKKEDE